MALGISAASKRREYHISYYSETGTSGSENANVAGCVGLDAYIGVGVESYFLTARTRWTGIGAL